MKWRTETRQEKMIRYRKEQFEKYTKWHKWFAWHRVRLSDDEHEVRWLEFIYRKGTLHSNLGGDFYTWEYVDNIFGILKVNE